MKFGRNMLTNDLVIKTVDWQAANTLADVTSIQSPFHLSTYSRFLIAFSWCDKYQILSLFYPLLHRLFLDYDIIFFYF